VVQSGSSNVVVKESQTMRTLTRALLPALMLALLPLAAPASVVVGVSVNFAPPALPVYVQPAIPAPGYIWTPGYWAWGPGGYYWVPGTWVQPPAVGLLWTPGYWGWAGGAYLWHVGYWGPHVGFYGGINYGCGYGGVGYAGGYWHGSQFLYNTSVNNVRNINVTNVYTRTVVNTPVSRASFNGGTGGIVARPSPAELSAEHERHVGYTGLQREHETLAQTNNALRASVNGGRPPIAATAHPAVFTGQGVVPAHAAQGGGQSVNPQYAGHASYPGRPQDSTHTSAGAGSPYAGHLPYTANTQYPGHAASAGNPQYSAHAPAGTGTPYAAHSPSAGQPGGSPAHAPAAAPQGHPGGHEPHGEAPGRR
jgi:hypothetical protein